MQSDVAKTELKRQSKKEKKRRSSVNVDAAEFHKNNKNGQWSDDSDVKRCMICDKGFSLTLRRHHCRECGGIFCDACSSRKLIINGQLKRACENCYENVVSGKNKSLGPVTFPSALSNMNNDNRKSFLDNMTDNSLSPRPSSLARKVINGEVIPPNANGSTSQVPQYPWVKALLLIRSLGRNSEDKPEIDSCFPEVLSEQMMEDIMHIAMPNELNKERESLEFNFTFRIDQRKYSSSSSEEEGRESSSSVDSESAGDESDLLYGFVLYRQKQLYMGSEDSRTSRPICQSLVMISEVPVPYLAYRFLTNLEDALFHILSISSAMQQERESFDLGKSVEQSSDRTTVKEEVHRALQVGINMASSWPAVELTEASPSVNLALPLLGEVVQFSVSLPCIVPRSLCSIAEPFRFSKMSLGSSVTYSSGTNLISQFGPYGLLPHLWVLWELLVQGKDIVVLSHFADACSEMVMALSSLVIASSNHYRGGAVYPYISRYNKEEVNRIAAEAKEKKLQMENNAQQSPDQSPSTIVGITDPSLLQDFRHFAVLVILSPKVSELEGQNGGSSPSHVTKKSVALQKSINSIHTMSGNKTPLQKLADESIVKYNPKFASPLKTASDFEPPAGSKDSPVKAKSKVGIFAKGFIHWKRSKDASGANAPPAYVIIQAPAETISFPKKLQERVCSRLQKLSKRDYLVLGDRILRDHFNEMSERIFEPLPVDEKLSRATVSAKNKTRDSQEQDEYEEVEIEVEESGSVATATGGAGGAGANGAVSTLLKLLKANHDSLQISTFRNFLCAILGSFLLLCNRVTSLPPMWIIVLILTGYFVPSEEVFNQFVADHTTGGASTGSTKSTKVKKMVKRKKVNQGASSTASTVAVVKTDYSGIWKRVKAVNFEAFAAAQGAGYVQRKLAASIEMIVTITMDAPHLTSVRIQEDGGPIHSDNTMVIGGEPSEAPLGQKLYADTATWHGEGSDAVLQVIKVLQPKKEYELHVRRYLENDGQSLRQEQTFVGADGKRVECQSFFTRVGDSASTPPVSHFPPGHEATASEQATTPSAEVTSSASEQNNDKADSETPSGPTKVDFSGVWSRYKSHNMDSYAGALGAGYMQRKLAGSIAMEHTITMNPPELSAFRLQEVGGPLKTDTLYTVNATEPIETKLGKNPHHDMVHWRTSVTAGTLLEAMPSQGPTLVVTKTPIGGGGGYTVYQGRYMEDEKTLVVVNIHHNHASGVETVATNWFKQTGPSPHPAPVPPLPIKSSGTNEESSDVSSTPAAETPTPTESTSNTAPQHQQARQTSSASLRVNFSGVWERQADDSEKMMSTVMKSGDGVVKSTHSITMDTPDLNKFHLVETSSKTKSELSYDIGGDYIETSHDGKAFKEKCYWLGEALVIQRLSLANDVEVIITRYLENSRLRLVTVRKNLNTGDTTESVSFFTQAEGKQEKKETPGSDEGN